MARREDRDGATSETPEEMFSILGNETRLRVLQVLGEAGEPLRFSALFERTDYDDAPNFNYHLDRLRGQFIEDTDEGYVLRPEGRRVVKAVLAGFMAEKPVVERTEVETPCFLCGADEMEVSYRNGTIGVFCPACGGRGGGSGATNGAGEESTADIIGNVGLPSAGVRNRSPTDILRVGELWSCWIAHALARDVCPECSAPVDLSVQVCDSHSIQDGRCPACGLRAEIAVTADCSHCIRDQRFGYAALLLAHPEVMGFMLDHGMDPMVPHAFHHASLEEEVLSAEPFRGRFTFTADDEQLTLTVNDDLSVVEATRG